MEFKCAKWTGLNWIKIGSNDKLKESVKGSKLIDTLTVTDGQTSCKIWNANKIKWYIPFDIFPKRYNVHFWKTALHVSGGISNHHQEHTQLYLQYLVLVKPLLLPAAIVDELKLVWVWCGNCIDLFWWSCWRTSAWRGQNWSTPWQLQTVRRAAKFEVLRKSNGMFLLIYFQQDATLHGLFISGKPLYMFRVASPLIIRRTNNCIYSIWYLLNRYCYMPLLWMSWNWFECDVGIVLICFGAVAVATAPKQMNTIPTSHSNQFQPIHNSGR